MPTQALKLTQPPPSQTTPAPVPRNYTTILDKMVLDSKCAPFVRKLAEASMTSILSSKGVDNNKRKTLRYTVLVPTNSGKIGKWKTEELSQLLRSHIIRGWFDPAFIEKTCKDKRDENGAPLKALTMKTMYTGRRNPEGVKLSRVVTIDCAERTVALGDGKPTRIRLGKPHLVGHNGIVYLIDDPLFT